MNHLDPRDRGPGVFFYAVEEDGLQDFPTLHCRRLRKRLGLRRQRASNASWLSARVIAAEFAISIADVNAAVELKMPRIDNPYRARALALDLERLERLTARCLDALDKGSLAAGHLLLKTCERRAHMLGLDSPLRVDAVQLIELAGPHETSTENLRRVFEELRRERIAEELPAPPLLPN
jgi:hypothetical protein